MRGKAKFNMELDHGHFIKGKIYDIERDDSRYAYWVESEEHMRQGFFFDEIGNFFEII